MEKETKIMDRSDVTSFVWGIFVKNITLLGLISLGLLGRFSYDLLRSKRFTLAYILGCTGASFVVGYVGGSYVAVHWPDNSVALTVLTTMIANNLVSAVMSIDYKELFKKNWKEAFEVLTRSKRD